VILELLPLADLASSPPGGQINTNSRIARRLHACYVTQNNTAGTRDNRDTDRFTNNTSIH
jgi:hypothetical protein